MPKRGKRQLREQLASQQDGACPWCKLPLPDDLAGTAIDHIIPRCRGGPDEPWNQQLLHLQCNGTGGKGYRLTAEAEELAALHGVVLREPPLTSWPGSNKAGSSGQPRPHSERLAG